MDSPTWNLNSSHHLNQKMEHLTRAGPYPGYLQTLEYIDDPFVYQSLRPALHVETTMQSMSLDHYPECGPLDLQQDQCRYLKGFQSNISISQGAAGETQSFDGQDTIWTDNLSSPSLHSTSTYSSPIEGSILSPRATRHSSFSSTQSISDYANIQLLEAMTLESPTFHAALFGEHYHLPTIVDRVQRLSLHSMRLFNSCGSDPNIQSAVLDILESPEMQANAPITSEMAAPLLEKIKYVNKTHGKGKRGAPQFYKCLWGSCGEKMARKLHALEHIMNHLDNRSHVCDHCGKGFVRKNELKKHSPCKALKRSLRCVNHGPVPMQLECTSPPPSSNTTSEHQLLPVNSWTSSASTEPGPLRYSKESPQTTSPMSSTIRPRGTPYNANMLTIGSWNPQASA